MTTILAINGGGGNGFRAVNAVGEQLEFIATLPIEELNPVRLVSFIAHMAQQIKADAIGISTSGFVIDGVITKSTNIGLPPNFPITELVAKATSVPVVAANDGVAETKGASIIFPDLVRFIYVIDGGGLGQNEFDQGRIKLIDERGHMVGDFSPFAMFCACGVIGCFESVIGGESMKRRVLWAINALKLKLPTDMHPLAFLDEQFRAGAPWATTTYRQYAKGLGAYLYNLLAGNNAQTIVFHGSMVTKAMRLPGIEEWVRFHMAGHMPDKSWANVEFRFIPERKDMPNDYVSFLGAAAFAKELLIGT